MNTSWVTKRMRRLLGKRQFQVFGVGTGRTGTTTIHRMFASSYHSRHEPEFDLLIPLIIENNSGKPNRDALSDYVVQKDNRLRLEMDSSWMNYFVVDELCSKFPEAKFLLTVRDVFSWAESVYNRAVNREVRPPWKTMRAFVRRRWPAKYERGEERLETLGLRPLGSLFSQWRDVNQKVLETVPRDRLLIIKTEEISRSRERIAAFLGVSADTLAMPSRNNATTRANKILLQLDRNLVNDTASKHCADVMKVIYPDFEVTSEGFAIRQSAITESPATVRDCLANSLPAAASR